MIVIKEKDALNSALVVDNGPELMDEDKVYTDVFNDLIKEFPEILSATFYNKTFTSYKIKIAGVRPKTILGIKNFLIDLETKEE